jgi:hypothetical protein
MTIKKDRQIETLKTLGEINDISTLAPAEAIASEPASSVKAPQPPPALSPAAAPRVFAVLKDGTLVSALTVELVESTPVKSTLMMTFPVGVHGVLHVHKLRVVVGDRTYNTPPLVPHSPGSCIAYTEADKIKLKLAPNILGQRDSLVKELYEHGRR